MLFCVVILDELGRLVMINILCNVFWIVIVIIFKDLLVVVILLVNRIVLVYEGVELGIGDVVIIKVFIEVYGRKDD